jgi:LDH2 family malate/lactate/ureidoglycolate dehydrogenase
VFLAFHLRAFGNADAIADGIIASLRGPAEDARYPGEQVIRIRTENLALGVPVDPAVWREVAGL